MYKMLMPAVWHFLTQTDAGLFTRIAVGAAIFMTLALLDLRANGPSATRWKEYLFLLAAVGAALVYGVSNDLITSSISWEYFVYGKDLLHAVGDRVPPDRLVMAREAAKVGLKATWTAGLLIGVAMLLANNPTKPSRHAANPPVSYPSLLKLLPIIFLCCFAFAIPLGFAGYLGWLNCFSQDFREMTRRDEFRPARYIAVYGIHLGGYVGAAIGTGAAVVRIRIRRRQLAGHPADGRGEVVLASEHVSAATIQSR
jgi:hypothetical protein